MPYKLVPPRPGRSPFYAVRGTHCGIYLNRSTKFAEEGKARALLRLWRDEAERGRLSRPGDPTFLSALVAYVKAGGDDRFLGEYDEETGLWSGLAGKLADKSLAEIDQQLIDQTAIELYPKATPATRNRQVHTPISAILKHAGIDQKLRRPKGWRGTPRVDWMKPDQAFRLINAATATDAEFGLFLTVLLYTGMRLSEALGLRCEKLDLREAWAWVSKTKNGTPRMVYLPPVAVAALANHPRSVDRSTEKVFRFVKCGRLYTLLRQAKKAAGPELAFVSFHTFRHTWATWMRRYGGLDTTGLVNTGTWKDAASARRYEHADVTAEAKRADLLPVAPTRAKSVRKRRKRA